MKLSYVAVAGLVASIVYLCGALLVSQYSGDAQSALEAHVERLEENVRKLEIRNRSLVAEAELYRRSSDAVAVQARPLQYYETGQGVIRIDNAPIRGRSRSPGTIVRRPPDRPDRLGYVRIAAVIAFLASIFVQSLLEPAHPRPAHVMRRASR
ncbi:MAG: septum formation initiator family protein [Spirochaetota bacterium]